MTIKDFLEEVAYACEGRWRARLDRKKIEVQFAYGERGTHWVSPIEALYKDRYGKYGGTQEDTAVILGIPDRHIDNLVAAIYGHGGEPSLRRRLLKACGLEEVKL